MKPDDQEDQRMMETERQEKIETSRKYRKRHGVGQCLFLNPSSTRRRSEEQSAGGATGSGLQREPVDADGDEVMQLACADDFEEQDMENFEEEPEESYHSGQAEFHDDRTGKPLDAGRVRAAREEEVKELERRVYVTANVTECWEKTGKRPIGVRWVDIEKGFGVHRSRLVAKDFRPKSKVNDREGLYAATPPLEMVKFLIMRAAMRSKQGEIRKVMFIDIGKAHLYAPIEGEVFVDLPPERAEEGKCAKLMYTLYGLRTAASSWEKEYSQTLEQEGFVAGKATSCTFYHEERDVRVVVHGDDFIIEGRETELQWVRTVLESKYIVKMRAMLGPERGDTKVAEILSRTVEWREEEIWYEADPRHVEKMLADMEMEDCNSNAVPGTKVQSEEGDDEVLDRVTRTRYRSAVARANFLAQDRPDIRYSVKELCRMMSCPTEGSWKQLKKLCRYLKGKPRMVQKVQIGLEDSGFLEVYVDSDWAGCSQTRKSTSGGCLMWNGICLKAWSTTQTAVAMSSGEAEYYAAVRGSAEGLAFQSMCRDVGAGVRVRVHTDSTACRGVCNRRGIGRIRHMDVALLWLQDHVRSGAVLLVKVPGVDNPADLMTKFLGGPDLRRHVETLGFSEESGRSRVVDGIG